MVNLIRWFLKLFDASGRLERIHRLGDRRGDLREGRHVAVYGGGGIACPGHHIAADCGQKPMGGNDYVSIIPDDHQRGAFRRLDHWQPDRPR